MPTVNATTKGSRSVWKSPDGQREIFELALDVDGQMLKAKTFSGDIAREGWSGMVETYEKDGKYGAETYVKQPAKEGFQRGSSTAVSAGPKPAFTPGKPQDQYTMYLSYAKDLLVSLVNTSGYDVEAFNQLLAEAVRGGKYLFDNRPGNEPEKVADEPINLNKIDEIFGTQDTEGVWPKQ